MAGEVLQEGRSLVVAFNKIDALSKPDQALVRQQGPKMVSKIVAQYTHINMQTIS